MRRTRAVLGWLMMAALAAGLVTCGCRRAETPGAGATAVNRPPRLDPDCAGTTIPSNLAPLSFIVREPGVAYAAEWRNGSGASLAVGGRTASLSFPLRQWRALAGREGDRLTCAVSVKDASGRWQAFAPVAVTVGPPVDPFLSYRLIGPVYSYYRDIRIMQRDLTSFATREVLSNARLNEGCVNCHTPCAGRPDHTTLGIRSSSAGNCALVAVNGRVTKVDATWGYNAWHPSGQAVAYSMNKVRQFFHDTGAEVRDVVDLDSDLLLYRADTGQVETDAAIADPGRMETYPNWAPDGKTLYFCSAPILWKDRDRVPPAEYAQVRYDLRRVSYDFATQRFGTPETVLSAARTGRSLLQPRVSPDGRWLLFTMCQYGCFPVYQPSSDLYLMDLESGTYRRLELNSDQSESWHSWSSNSRWIAFSSKRLDGVFTRTFLAHVDEQGRVGKPFVLPQRDPAFYGSFLKTFSVPELMTGPVMTTPARLAAAVRSTRQLKLTLPEVSMTRKAKTPSPPEPWQQTGKP